MKNWWVSWYGTASPFTLESPWWISGYRCDGIEGMSETPTICAAIQAESEEDAKDIVLASHDTPPADLEWRFVFERPEGWSPYGDRFPRADWMRWP